MSDLSIIVLIEFKILPVYVGVILILIIMTVLKMKNHNNIIFKLINIYLHYK